MTFGVALGNHLSKPPFGPRVKAVGFTGMPGSGKSEAMAVAKELGYPVVRMGDLIWEEVDRQGLERISKNVGAVANGMRESHGPDIWALRTIERIREVAHGSPIVIWQRA